MKFLYLCLAVVLFQDLPYKPKEEFDIKLDYKFKQRPTSEATTINVSESRAEHDRRTSTSPLPYLVLNVHILKLNNESRLRISNNANGKIALRKVTEGTILPIDMGFTADVKDRVTPHEYILTFIGADKSETSRIVIHVEQDGTFLVNGEKRGRF